MGSNQKSAGKIFKEPQDNKQRQNDIAIRKQRHAKHSRDARAKKKQQVEELKRLAGSNGENFKKILRHSCNLLHNTQQLAKQKLRQGQERNNQLYKSYKNFKQNSWSKLQEWKDLAYYLDKVNNYIRTDQDILLQVSANQIIKQHCPGLWKNVNKESRNTASAVRLSQPQLVNPTPGACESNAIDTACQDPSVIISTMPHYNGCTMFFKQPPVAVVASKRVGVGRITQDDNSRFGGECSLCSLLL